MISLIKSDAKRRACQFFPPFLILPAFYKAYIRYNDLIVKYKNWKCQILS
jgi:hypothetical protein